MRVHRRVRCDSSREPLGFAELGELFLVLTRATHLPGTAAGVFDGLNRGLVISVRMWQERRDSHSVMRAERLLCSGRLQVAGGAAEAGFAGVDGLHPDGEFVVDRLPCSDGDALGQHLELDHVSGSWAEPELTCVDSSLP